MSEILLNVTRESATFTSKKRWVHRLCTHRLTERAHRLTVISTQVDRVSTLVNLRAAFMSAVQNTPVIHVCRFRAWKEQRTRLYGLSPEIKARIWPWTVQHVPCSLDS